MKSHRKVKAKAKPVASLIAQNSPAYGTELSTQQKLTRAALALDDTEERLRAILETAVEGIITIDERGIIESMNPAAAKIFGYKPSEVIGKNVNILMPSPYHEQHDGYLANYRHTGKAQIIGIGREVVGRRKDGSTFPMDLSVGEVKLANRRLFTGFVRDITERKRLEKEILETSDREQRRIGQDLHDGLCQQLAGIELMSEVLEQNLAGKSNAEAPRAREIGAHVRDAISHTRLLARGLSPVTLESEGLMAALHELAANTKKIFNVDCIFECDPPVPLDDQTTATQLFRIAQEAVSNAVRHGKATRIIIQLKEQRGKIIVTVSDNGTGFPKIIPKQKGMGLRIMESRAVMIGGTLVLEKNRDGGVKVMCGVSRTATRKPTESIRANKKNKSNR
ncbi:MAG: two-component system, LuxR family, sensor kinase FixL [Verrucomicrobiota bacterium]|jgi:two-component system CheB/CheR fusion protein